MTKEQKALVADLTDYSKAVFDVILDQAPAGMREVCEGLTSKKQPIQKSSIRRTAKQRLGAKLSALYQEPPIGWVFDKPGGKKGAQAIVAKRGTASKKPAAKKAPRKPKTRGEIAAEKKAPTKDALFERALSLKAEVYVGKRTPKSALESLAAEFSTAEKWKVDDAWSKAWWHGIPGGAHQVDLSLLKSAKWTIGQGRKYGGVELDGEGQAMKSSKWYFSPPGFDGVYSKAYGTKTECEKAAAKTCRELTEESTAVEIAKATKNGAAKPQRKTRSTKKTSVKRAQSKPRNAQA